MERKARNNSILKMILTALMIALTFVAGSVIKIPTLNGFIQIGDCMVLLGAVLLGKRRGALSGAIGMCFVDITAGYLIWAPFTFVIKGLMAYVVGIILEKKDNIDYKTYVIAFIIGGFINVIGYFMGNAIIGGVIIGNAKGILQSIIYASANIMGDTIQSIIGIIIALILAPSINKAKLKLNF